MGINHNMKAEELTTRDLRQLETLRASILRSRELSAPCLMVLLTVALRPGLSVNELATELEMPQQTASRNASILLGRYEDHLFNTIKTPFIQQFINDEDPKKRTLELTDAGIAYLHRVLGDHLSNERKKT